MARKGDLYVSAIDFLDECLQGVDIYHAFREDANVCQEALTKDLRLVLAGHFGASSQNARFYVPPARSGRGGDNKSRFPVGVTLQAAKYLARKLQPGLLKYVEMFSSYTFTVQDQPVSRVAYPGPRPFDQRIPDLETLSVHIRHLASLTYSTRVTDANADGALSIKKFRENSVSIDTIYMFDLPSVG